MVTRLKLNLCCTGISEPKFPSVYLQSTVCELRAILIQVNPNDNKVESQILVRSSVFKLQVNLHHFIAREIPVNVP